MGRGDQTDALRKEGERLFSGSPTYANRGERAPAKSPQYIGAIVTQPAAALDAFVRLASPNNEFVIAEAPSEPRDSECWPRAAELIHEGLVRGVHRRRRAGGGWQYFIVRSGKTLPRQMTPQQKALADRATAAIFVELKRAASLGLACPSNSDLMDKAGLNQRQQASWRVRALANAGLIAVQTLYEANVQSRVVEILAGKHAGQAAGKSTAYPKKWAALQKAAARDAGVGR